MSTSDRDKPPPARPSITSTVGYGRPPVEHRFKPGQSGNPRGRRKGAKNAATILEEQLFRTIRVRVGNSEIRMTVFEAIHRRFIEEALRGNIKSATFILNRANAVSSENLVPELSQDDATILKQFAEEILKTAPGGSES